MKIELDSTLNVIAVNEGSNPIVSIPMVDLVKLKEPSIVDVF